MLPILQPLDIPEQTAPANPAAGTRRIFVDSGTGKLSVRTSGGATVSLEEQDTTTPAAHASSHISGGGDAFTSGQLLEAIIKRIQTSTGPTTLTVGAISDGEFLKRVGTDIVSAAAGGASAFTGLSDVPSSYSGKALDLVRVNSGATALEFVAEGTDFLTQYLLLAGRSGGQTIIGDTASGGNLTLMPTSHATKGAIIFGSADANGAKMAIVGNNTATLSRGDGANTINLRDAEIKGYTFCSSGFSGSGWIQGSRLTCTLSNTTFYSGSDAGDGSSVWTFTSGAVGLVCLTVKPKASQTANQQVWQTSAGSVLSYVNAAGNVGVRMGATAATAYLHLAGVTTAASTAPIKFVSGTLMTTAEAGAMEYDNKLQFTESDAVRRFIVQAAAATKTTAGAPYTNDGYVTVTINGTDLKLLTTA